MYKLIFTSYIAKELLNMGNPIIDLQKNHKLQNATVFVFDNTDKLQHDLAIITQKYNK
jgi:hypothetical protein